MLARRATATLDDHRLPRFTAQAGQVVEFRIWGFAQQPSLLTFNTGGHTVGSLMQPFSNRRAW